MPAAELFDDVRHEKLRRRRARGDAHARGVRQPLGADVVLVGDQVGRRAHDPGHLHEAVGIRAIGGADHEQDVHLARDGLDGGLAVLRGIADVVLGRADDLREAPAQRLDAIARVVHRQRGLRQVRDLVGVGHREAIHVLRMRDQEHAVRRLPHRPHHLVVVGVADEDDRVALARVADGLEMHLGDERTRRVDDPQAAPLRLVAHRGRDPVRAEDDGGVVGHLGQLVDEVRALGAKRLDHVAVVDDLLAHVHGVWTHLRAPARRCRWRGRRPRRSRAALRGRSPADAWCWPWLRVMRRV